MPNTNEFWDFRAGAAFSGGVTIPANAISSDSQVASGANITRAKLVTETNAPFPVDILSAKIHDTGAGLPIVVTGSGTAGDLWLDVGTLASESIMLQSDDANGAAYTQYALLLTRLPECYVDGEAVTLRIPAKMGVLADTTNGLDAEVYECASGVTPGDICATAVQTMTASWANYDFTITPTLLVAGDVLKIRIATVLDDTAAGSGAGVIAYIDTPRLLVSIKG